MKIKLRLTSTPQQQLAPQMVVTNELLEKYLLILQVSGSTEMRLNSPTPFWTRST